MQVAAVVAVIHRQGPLLALEEEEAQVMAALL
jgi:hypothetical protein